VPACQDAVCALDAFCCDNTWDGLCAGDAINHAACEACLSTAPGEFGCSDASFEVILNPSTDNFTALAETDFCASGDGEVVYSAMTCPSCFPATFVETDDINSDNVDVCWTSVNPAGTSVTVYVGLPGFDPMVDPVASENIVITGPGVQGPVNITVFSTITNNEVIILGDRTGDPSDGSQPRAVVAPIVNDVC